MNDKDLLSTPKNKMTPVNAYNFLAKVAHIVLAGNRGYLSKGGEYA